MTDAETAVFKVHIRGSSDDVWHEITKTDEVQGAMFNTRMHTNGLGVGGQIRMRSANGKYTGVVGDIIEYDPPHRFAHTFKFTQYDDPPCVVRYELKQLEDGVDFMLTCENMPARTKSKRQMMQGGNWIVKALQAIVETGKPPVSVRLMYFMFKLMEPLSPKSTLTERWPFDVAQNQTGK